MFVVDSSGSVGKKNFNKMRLFVKNVVESWQVGPQHTRFGERFHMTHLSVTIINNNQLRCPSGYSGEHVRYQLSRLGSNPAGSVDGIPDHA